MKRLLTLFIFLSMLFSSVHAFSQTAKVVDIKGKVLVRQETSQDWRKARLNMVLDKEAELQTKKNSKCTLAFDEGLKNILTVEENSHITIKNVKPGDVFLSEGRVFSLIEGLSKAETFQVKTPTAVAGARGTGWLTIFEKYVSREFCFDDQIYLQGLDASGNITQEGTLGAGKGIDISAAGAFGDTYALGDREYGLWNEFMFDAYGLRVGRQGSDDAGNIEDLRGEQREDFRDITDEIRRRDRESTSGDDPYRPQ